MILPEGLVNLNTPLILAAILYLYRQAGMVSTLRQALVGINGQNGALGDIKELRGEVNELNRTTTVLGSNVAALANSVEELAQAIEARQRRRP